MNRAQELLQRIEEINFSKEQQDAWSRKAASPRTAADDDRAELRQRTTLTGRALLGNTDAEDRAQAWRARESTRATQVTPTRK